MQQQISKKPHGSGRAIVVTYVGLSIAVVVADLIWRSPTEAAAIATALALVVIAYQSWQTRRSATATEEAAQATLRSAAATETAAAATQAAADATRQEADATREEADATRKSSEAILAQAEAAQRPVMVVTTSAGGQVVLANLGSGPALNCIYFAHGDGRPDWSQTGVLNIGSRDRLTTSWAQSHLPLVLSMFGDAPGPLREVVMCEDVVGRAYRFTVPKPVPEIWDPAAGGAEPEWAHIYLSEVRRIPHS